MTSDQAVQAWDAWKSVFSLSISPGDASQKRFLGSRSNRVCKFCGRTSEEASFRSDSHVIPAAFGNRSLFSYEECDDCNQRGSTLEDDLAKFLALPRVISRLPARRGTPKLRHPNQKAHVASDGAANRVQVYECTDEEGIHVEDDGDGVLRLTVATPKYRPVNLARALGRMLLFGMDSTEVGFDRILRWVRGDVDWFPIPITVLTIPKTETRNVSVMVHRYTKSPERSILRVGFVYTWFMVLVPIPLDHWNVPENVEFLNTRLLHHTGLSDCAFQLLVVDDAPDSTAEQCVTVTYGQRTKVE